MISAARRENFLDRVLVSGLIDPLLSRSAVRARLKGEIESESRLVRFALRYLVDPTILPPPSYTRARADAVYGPAFQRCVEFAARSGLEGDIFEFGTLLGYTGRWLAGLMRLEEFPGRLWLFDSFEGLPNICSVVDRNSYEVSAAGRWRHGAMKVDPEIHHRVRTTIARLLVKDRLQVVKGYFEQTVPAQLTSGKAAIVHVDCDLYSSARFVLDALIKRDFIQDGTVLILDDYNCNRAQPGMGERRALAEVFAQQDRFTVSPWFSYGWHGQVFFVHECRAPEPNV